MPKFSFSSSDILKMYQAKSSAFWSALQDKEISEVFKSAVKTKAYKKFLKSSRAANPKNPKQIFSLPFVDKKNYFKKNGLELLAEDKYFKRSSSVITATSGSTGEPAYFPRTHFIDWQYSVLAEFFLNNGKPGSTLVMDCFGMGVWIGGVITYQAFYEAGLRGSPVSIITPGIKKSEIFFALKNLAPQFDNLILTGYPPFIKDIIDEAAAEGIDWKKLNLRVIFAAESFTEDFRDYICKKAGIKNALLDTLNIYGSAELGAMAFETPTSILVRRLALRSEKLYASLFAGRKLPTLAQFNPLFVIFSERNGEILISAKNVLPMVNYKIGDSGGVYTYKQLAAKFLEFGIDLGKEAKKQGIKITQLPFVYVYERSDFVVSFYGANIYPQHVKQALIHKNYNSLVTGKFSMQVNNNKKHNEVLEINIELARDAKITSKLRKELTEHLVQEMARLNAEYENNNKLMPKRNRPTLKLWPHEHPKYFAPGVKQKWKI